MQDFRITHCPDVMNTFIHRSELTRSFTVKEHTVMYVIEGDIDIGGGSKVTTLRAGDCAFIRRNHQVTIRRHAGFGEGGHLSIAINIPRQSLVAYYRGLPGRDVPRSLSAKDYPEIERIPVSLESVSFFDSFRPFYEAEVLPEREWLARKVSELISSLLRMDARLFPVLFDFTSQWKTDILEFMEESFRDGLSISEIAYYTGRSLATFKRDFAKISDLTPEKWLTRRKLEAARDALLSGAGSVTEAAVSAGFVNMSAFCRAYRMQFGHSAGKDLKK